MAKRKKKRKKRHSQPKPNRKADNKASSDFHSAKPARQTMQVAVTLLGGLSLILFSLFGVMYSHHKIGAIWFLFFPAALITIFAACLQWHLLVSRQLGSPGGPEVSTSGLLVPANDPTPPNACETDRGYHKAKGAMLVILGNSAAWSTRLPQTIIEIGNDKMLTMNKVRGRLSLSGKFFGPDFRIVAELRNNLFYVNPNDYFRIERPNAHSLIVFDQQDVQVLNVRFVNPHTIVLAGVIRHPGNTVIISKTEGVFSNFVCSGPAFGTAFKFTP